MEEKQGEPITFLGSNGVELSGRAFMPDAYLKEVDGGFIHTIPFGSIYFVHGLSGRWVDYKPLLLPLSDEFNVFAYDQRGHGMSRGVYSPQKAADDLETIVERDAGSVGIVGHSIGCHTAVEVAKRFEAKGRPLKGIYLLEPCLGIDSFTPGKQKVFNILHALYALCAPFDALLTVLPFARHLLGLHQVLPLYTTASLSQISSRDCEGLQSTAVGYMLANNDGLLGTNNQDHYFACMARLRELFSWRPGFRGVPIPYDNSDAAEGLNHCFNYKGQVPFLKDEKDKKSAKIVEKIVNFFEGVFGKVE
jgi:pimeloyl-ACP methyl ester carboxylesterase